MTSFLNNYWSRDLHKSAVLPYAASIAVLTVIGLIAYGSSYAPILYNDDWSLLIGRWYFGALRWFSFTELRPFQLAPLMMIYGLFGVNVHVMYLIVWTLNVVAAIQLYLLGFRLLPGHQLLAFTIGAVFLVYPADFSRMWLTQIHGRLAMVLVLLYAHLLLVYWDTYRRWALYGALLALVCSLAVYEAQLGLAMGWCVLLLLASRKRSWKELMVLSSPLVVAAIFVLWRTVGYSMLGISGDHYGYNERINLTLTVLITRLIIGYQVLIWAWLVPLVRAYGLNQPQAIIIFLAAVAFLGVLAYAVNRLYRRSQNRYLTQQEHLDQVRSFMLVAVIGPVLIAAGYVPFIALFEPTTYFQTGSRINAFALPGAAITTVALLILLTLLLKRNWKPGEINVVGLAALFPLIILGTMVHARIQYDDRVAWERQKQIWRQLFELAPDLKNETAVYFVLSETRNREPSLNVTEKRLPVNASWEVRAALNVLYGQQDLKGDVFVRELLHMEDDFLRKEIFRREGIKNYTTDEIVPYGQALFVTYDSDQNRLKVIEDLEAEDLVDFPVPTYAPYDRIIQTPTKRVQLRWLVGETTH